MSDAEARALAATTTALRLVSISLPHLAGLARAVRVQTDARVPTAAISGGGRLLINPAWFATLNREDATYVVAHELLHLALDTHVRGAGADRALFNIAHDYIINDMLSAALERPAPAQGLQREGARFESAERIVALLRWSARGDEHSWGGGSGVPDSPLSTALRAAGLAPDIPPATGDVLPEELERLWFADADTAAERQQRRRVHEAAAAAVSMERVREAIERQPAAPGGSDAYTDVIAALRHHYRPPWEMALQQWLEAVAPGPRSFARPSRRDAGRTDVVLPGRTRSGWTLHIVLDTSGSMSDVIARALGAIASFCESVNVGLVHIVQCDTDVTRDELVDPARLSSFSVTGYGSSDMTPAMERLAADAEVEAAIVVTDGDIAYPSRPMPYAVLWALSAAGDWFRPPYGRVIAMT